MRIFHLDIHQLGLQFLFSCLENPRKFTTIWQIHATEYYFQGVDLGAGEPEWIVTKERSKWDAIFESLGPVKGKISGSTAKKEMIKSKLPNPVLAKVWRLSDVDADGALDSDEFALAMHLIHIKLDGYDLPEDLPEHLVPPSKKRYSPTCYH